MMTPAFYNGSPERFSWRLVGKRRSSLPPPPKFVFQTRLEDAGPHVSQAQYIRWEKHRVWVVDSTLKEGQRHIYSRRTFYIDEDSWAAVASDI